MAEHLGFLYVDEEIVARAAAKAAEATWRARVDAGTARVKAATAGGNPAARDMALGISQAVGRLFEGNSLDNTLRMVRVHPTEWILADIRVHGLAEGFGHGLVHLWAEDGTLLATASQSAIVRNPRKGDMRAGGAS